MNLWQPFIQLHGRESLLGTSPPPIETCEVILKQSARIRCGVPLAAPVFIDNNVDLNVLYLMRLSVGEVQVARDGLFTIEPSMMHGVGIVLHYCHTFLGLFPAQRSMAF